MPPEANVTRAQQQPHRFELARKNRSSTELDKIVSHLLCQSLLPLTAYELAKGSADSGSALTPTQVYRVLARLIARNEVRRIESLGAYLPSAGRPTGLLICLDCRSVQRFPLLNVGTAFHEITSSENFRASRYIFEVIGHCSRCQRSGA